MNLPNKEIQLRNRLGIPSDAQKVLIFAETSHWDPNWLYTTLEYFNNHIRVILDKAISELLQERSRVYSVECVFFLKMYWDNCPEKRAIIRKLVNDGRIRLTGTGMTTPDTTLPETESIVRDYLRGYTWLLENGMTQKPRIAYFPDGFGHSPGVPAILNACGYEYSAISRIDGMSFPGTDYRLSGYFPRPGSNAWLLLREFKTLDFIWGSPDGSSVLCHWNSFTYFQGDNIVYIGPVKWMGTLYGLHARSEKHVAKRIGEFVSQLSPVSKTPYLFCPIGMDFNPPIEGLHKLIKRYNRMRYPVTGIYAIIASLEDYMDLVSFYRDRLPVLQADFNPYWMGFYVSRPKIKKRCKDLARDLLRAEKLSLIAKAYARQRRQRFDFPDLTSPWDTLILSNHHDFITGTSSDRVYKKEQKIWLEKANQEAKLAIEHARKFCPKPPRISKSTAPSWTFSKGLLKIESRFYSIEISERSGGCITKWIDKRTGKHCISGPCNDAISYEDSGGLWRMGNEFAGGIFKARDATSKHRPFIKTFEKNGILEVEVGSWLENRALTRMLWFKNDSPIVRMRIKGPPGIKRTVTVRFDSAVRLSSLFMDTPGAVVERPAKKLFEPTFWPAKSFVHIRDTRSEQGLALALYGPASICGEPNGRIEIIALRNAPREIAFRLLPIMAHPASGFEPGEQTFNYAVWFTEKGDWQKNRVRILAEDALRPAWLKPGEHDLDSLADSLITTDSKSVRVAATKPAYFGDGIIVRLISFGSPRLEAKLSYKGSKIKKAYLADAMERDIAKLPIVGGKAKVALPKHITTVRIII